MAMVNSGKRQPVDAENVAIQALAFLASDPEKLGRFLAVTGIGPADLRSAAQEPGFLAGVLDHIAEDDASLLEFTQGAGLSPDAVARAREVLSGPPIERDIP